jgi:WXXGXW repeat (2 copies)
MEPYVIAISSRRMEGQVENVRTALVLSLWIAGGAALTPLAASAAVGIDITVAPPAPQVEVLPAPRPGYVWAPGYWAWRGNAHVWIPGHWMGERHGYRWVPDRWEQHGDHWRYHAGYWER